MIRADRLITACRLATMVDGGEAALAAFAGCAHRDARGDSLVMGAAGVGEGGEADLADAASVEAVLEQGLDRISVGQALVGVAQVEMGVECEDADAVEA